VLTKGPARKVTIFLNEDTQHHMTALHDSIMTFLMHKESAAQQPRAPSPVSVRTTSYTRPKSRYWHSTCRSA